MPDVAWCGGISERRRIAALAEVQYIRVSPHDALGPVALAASFQVSMATPNLYRQECLHTWFPDMAKIVTPMLDVCDGSIYPNGRPGLGIELDMDGVNACRIESIGGVAITDPHGGGSGGLTGARTGGPRR